MGHCLASIFYDCVTLVRNIRGLNHRAPSKIKLTVALPSHSFPAHRPTTIITTGMAPSILTISQYPVTFVVNGEVLHTTCAYGS